MELENRYERHSVAVNGIPKHQQPRFSARVLAGLRRRCPTGAAFWDWRGAMYRSSSRSRAEGLEAIGALV